jgi:murein DD-endopeptidase MepM/ murein hydrolase activator NlpD
VSLGLALSACDVSPEFDRFGKVRSDQPTIVRQDPDENGVISYATYDVAVAQAGETVATIANRLGQDAVETARLNGIEPDTPLLAGELVILPDPGQSADAGTVQITSGPIRSAGSLDITQIAGAAIDRAEQTQPAADSNDPLRYRVAEGESAQDIAQRYKVSVRALADWNGLGPDMRLRPGQVLLIPSPGKIVMPRVRPVIDNGPKTTEVAKPGEGTLTPEPPSASTPKPLAIVPAEPNAAEPAPEPVAGSGVLTMPVTGSIIRDFEKGQSDGIDIAAQAGSTVVAAADGTVAAITRDTDGVPILVLRHADGLLSVYAGIEGITVKRGDQVTRGQKIAVIRDTNPAFLHFETRRGFDAIDPMTLLN